jgi:hypothetical protein
MRSVLAAAVVTAAMWYAPPPAHAMLGEGESPPEFEGKEFINSKKCDLKSLRGQVVLYEIFRTW